MRKDIYRSSMSMFMSSSSSVMTLFFFFLPSPQMRRQQQQHRQHFIAALLREKNDRQKTALRLLFSAVSLLCCLKLHLDHGQLAKAVSGQATHLHQAKRTTLKEQDSRFCCAPVLQAGLHPPDLLLLVTPHSLDPPHHAINLCLELALPRLLPLTLEPFRGHNEGGVSDPAVSTFKSARPERSDHSVCMRMSQRHGAV